MVSNDILNLPLGYMLAYIAWALWVSALCWRTRISMHFPISLQINMDCHFFLYSNMKWTLKKYIHHYVVCWAAQTIIMPHKYLFYVFVISLSVNCISLNVDIVFHVVLSTHPVIFLSLPPSLNPPDCHNLLIMWPKTCNCLVLMWVILCICDKLPAVLGY